MTLTNRSVKSPSFLVQMLHSVIVLTELLLSPAPTLLV
jgi:hypothetical protein